MAFCYPSKFGMVDFGKLDGTGLENTEFAKQVKDPLLV